MTKISVIIPVRNEAEKIERCLEAVFNQTKKPFEVIVVDGHSTDKTVENARRFPVKVVYEDYGTVGGARQVGVKNAEGDYVAFTGADYIPERYR
jgi:glycosyltransferase involved in cell wall biosynthesis